MSADLGAVNLGVVSLRDAETERVETGIDRAERKLDVFRQNRFAFTSLFYRNNLIRKADLIGSLHPDLGKLDLFFCFGYPDSAGRVNDLRHDLTIRLIFLQTFPCRLNI